MYLITYNNSEQFLIKINHILSLEKAMPMDKSLGHILYIHMLQKQNR